MADVTLTLSTDPLIELDIVGPGAAIAITEATRQASNAAASAATALAAAGPNYASTAAGLAATAVGDAFAVDNGDGTVTVYSHDAGDVATALRTLIKDPSASTAAGLLGATGGTVQAVITDLTTRAVSLTDTAAVFVDGKVASGLSLSRDDAGFVITPPTAGTAGQRHAGFMFDRIWGDDEAYIAGYQIMSDGSKPQTHTIFMSLVGHDNTVATYRPYIGMHGVSARGDYTPFTAYMDNAVEVCGGSTGAGPFDLGLTDPDVFHNFQNSYLQGWSVFGVHAQSVQSGNIAEFNGNVFIGAVDGTTKESTTGAVIAWHTGLLKTLVQSYAYNTGTFQNMAIWGAAIEVGLNTSTIGFFGATPAAKPTVTGSRGGNAALASLLTALASLGLITDSTSA